MKLTIPRKYVPLATFLILAAIVTVLTGTVFLAVQQVYRNGANDPQIEAAEEIVGYINDGAPLDAIVDTTRSTDISKSLGIVVAVFDKDGATIASSALIGEESPEPPKEAIEKAKQDGEYRFTWKPKDDIRMATIIRKANDDKGLVLIARNMREVDNRIQDLTKIIGLSWLVLLVLSGLLSWILAKLSSGTTIAVVEENIIVESPQAAESVSTVE